MRDVQGSGFVAMTAASSGENSVRTLPVYRRISSTVAQFCCVPPLWLVSGVCPGGVRLRGDNTLKAALSRPRHFLIHTAPPKPPSLILAFLQLLSQVMNTSIFASWCLVPMLWLLYFGEVASVFCGSIVSRYLLKKFIIKLTNKQIVIL